MTVLLQLLWSWKKDLTSYKKFYILITHTHGDHIGGLWLLVQFIFFVLKKTAIIIAPSTEVLNDISTVLTIEGNECSYYELVTTEQVLEKDWFSNCILTKHAPELENKCFGYHYLNLTKRIFAYKCEDSF